MNINWDIIKEKYPKSYKKFSEYMWYKKGKEGMLLLFEQYFKHNLCYCVLEKFFAYNEIFLSFITGMMMIENQFTNGFDNYDKTRIQAAYKAFEIMEGKEEIL